MRLSTLFSSVSGSGTSMVQLEDESFLCGTLSCTLARFFSIFANISHNKLYLGDEGHYQMATSKHATGRSFREQVGARVWNAFHTCHDWLLCACISHNLYNEPLSIPILVMGYYCQVLTSRLIFRSITNHL